ncbi:MAG: SO_0444 family Cu/Zn efflux transporter [Verrucomicrobia bacterium]|nr:SO_0444 family Cu/Zn efflux transporter [Verrucomicrobiota bacterium]
MIEAIKGIFVEAWVVVVESAPFVVFGLVVAGMLHIFLDPAIVARHLGRGRIRPVVMASVLGVPLPLCSCGVLPAALAIRRQGANDGAVTSFLVSTPETGVDSIAITYALLGPLMAVVRPIAAFVSGVATGLVQTLFGKPAATSPAVVKADACKVDACCSGDDCPPDEHARHHGFVARVGAGLRYAFKDLLGDIAGWFLLGVLIAGLITAAIPENTIGRYLGGGLLTMLVMLVVGIPLYVCSSASTPIAAALIFQDLSPGAALVFLMAGPATNATSITVVGGMLGKRAAAIYIGGISVCAVVMGLLLDGFLRLTGWRIIPSIGAAHERSFPVWRLLAGGVFLALVAALFLARVLPKLKHKATPACPHCAGEQTSPPCH